MKLPEILTRWLPGAANTQNTTSVMQGDHFDLEDIACDLCDAYAGLVNTGADRGALARVITALAGCALAQSYTGYAAWTPEDGEEGWTVPDTDKLAGLLLLEVARCADHGPAYEATEPRIAALDEVGLELLTVAAAYTTGVQVGQRLFELGSAVSERTGSAAGEALMPLARAHGFECCPGCGDAATEDVAS